MHGKIERKGAYQALAMYLRRFLRGRSSRESTSAEVGFSQSRTGSISMTSIVSTGKGRIMEVESWGKKGEKMRGSGNIIHDAPELARRGSKTSWMWSLTPQDDYSIYDNNIQTDFSFTREVCRNRVSSMGNESGVLHAFNPPSCPPKQYVQRFPIADSSPATLS